ncbi:MAG: YHS domain-containing protein [Fimbriimonadaceae bacterium]|nr:YHS domain-containing protein [Fimbriimonadaceae bacterium]QYK54767.1 MAG: YHS domain-containing protein [Fimbriimonadaceae bacterium]
MRLAPLFVGLALIMGCATQPEATASNDSAPIEKKPVAASDASWPTEVKVYRNEKGEVVCPVMNDVIASPEKADGYQDYEGTRYYFCCGMCPGKFKENPALYVKK